MIRYKTKFCIILNQWIYLKVRVLELHVYARNKVQMVYYILEILEPGVYQISGFVWKAEYYNTQ